MSYPSAPDRPSAMVRGLIVAIVVMTVAIVLLFGAIISRLLAPSGGAAGGAIDFADAPVVTISLPEGARVIDAVLGADRASFEIETADGRTEILTAPLSGFEAPVRLVVEPAS